MTASSLIFSCKGWEDCQLYAGVGFPAAVQFRVISSPGINSKTSVSGLKIVGGPIETITYILNHSCFKDLF